MAERTRTLVIALLSLFAIYFLLPSAPSNPSLNPCNKPSSICTINHIYSTKSPPATSKLLKVLYYNTHGGTTANLLSLLPLLTKPTNIHLSHFNPSQISGYGMPHSRAKSLIESGHVSWICSHADILIIGDTTPHGRAILESLLLDPPHQCTSRKVVVELTNRFDWDVQWGQDMDAYYTLFRELVKQSERDGRLEGRIEFVANNLAEGRWIEGRIGVSMEGRVRIVRPLGIVKGGGYEYPNDLPPQNKSVVATQRHKSNIHSYLLHELDLSDSLALFPFGHKYGGPQNLLKFKAFLEIPYQFSTMKFYENIASGVPQLIPTPRFLLELYYSGLHGLPIWDPAYSLATLDPGLLTNRYSLEWAKYVDYYAPEFESFVYLFDSFDELVALLGMEDLDVEKKVRVKGPLFYETYRKEIVREWELILMK